MSEMETPPPAQESDWEPEVKVRKRRTFAKDPETGATLNADGTPRKPRGSETGTEKPRKRKRGAEATPDEIMARANMLAGVKFVMAMATKCPEMIYTQEEAVTVAKGLIGVEREFDFEIDPKMAAVATLISALVAVESPKLIAIYARVMRDRQAKANENAHANNPVDDPSQMPSYQMAAE
jgi:hypothetical protein